MTEVRFELLLKKKTGTNNGIFENFLEIGYFREI